MESKKDYVFRIYRLALGAGLCENKKDFADLLEMSRGSVSSAMNGSERHLTEKFMQRVRLFAQTHGLEEDKPAAQPMPAPQEHSTPGDWKDRTIESQQRTIERLTQLLDQARGGVLTYTPAYTPKNFPAEK